MSPWSSENNAKKLTISQLYDKGDQRVVFVVDKQQSTVMGNLVVKTVNSWRKGCESFVWSLYASSWMFHLNSGLYTLRCLVYAGSVLCQDFCLADLDLALVPWHLGFTLDLPHHYCYIGLLAKPVFQHRTCSSFSVAGSLSVPRLLCCYPQLLFCIALWSNTLLLLPDTNSTTSFTLRRGLAPARWIWGCFGPVSPGSASSESEHIFLMHKHSWSNSWSKQQTRKHEQHTHSVLCFWLIRIKLHL